MTESTVYQKIAAITGELAKTGVAKDQKNDQQGYMFRGIDSIYGALASLLASHGLCLLPRIQGRTVTERVTKSGSTVKFYVNGVQQGSDQTGGFSTVFNGTAPVQIGGWTEDCCFFHDGLMDDTRAWSRALSATEIGDLYSSGYRILGKMEGSRTGHYLNNLLLKEIFSASDNYAIY